MLNILVRLLSSTEFKALMTLIVIIIIILVFMEVQARIVQGKLNKQQLRINDRILAGTI